MNSIKNKKETFSLLSWGIVFLTIFITVWGAWVRVSGSGDGCGANWPLCNQEIIPLNSTKNTWIEFTHRITTGLYGILIIIQLILSQKIFLKGSCVRRYSLYVFIFMILEAAIGAKLVLFGLVNQSLSYWRLVVMPLHSVNTLILLGSTVLTATTSSDERFYNKDKIFKPDLWRNALFFSFILLALTGALASLSTHLFPSLSLAEGVAKDLSFSGHPVEKLRIIHPLFAMFFATMCFSAIQRAKIIYKNELTFLFFVQIIFGISTLLFMSPVWMKLTHLFLMNILFVLFVFGSVKATGFRED